VGLSSISIGTPCDCLETSMVIGVVPGRLPITTRFAKRAILMLVGNEEDKSRCMAEMAKLIEVGEDDVRCYPLPARGFQCRIGLTSLPEGIQWTGLPAAIA